LRIFEVDRPGPQAWKRRRLLELGYGVPECLRFVPVDFEAASWWDQLLAGGFDPRQPAVVASTGVSMYLTREANVATLSQLAGLAPGSTVAMTFLRPVELVDAEDREMAERSQKGAAGSGTPFLSFFSPQEILALARTAGFPHVRHVSADDLAARYFAERVDDLRPSNGEELLVARTARA
jgi:methyltransferase (TIGR00027 family)